MHRQPEIGVQCVAPIRWRGKYIEESYKAWFCLGICKFTVIETSLKAVLPVVYIFVVLTTAHIYACRCELISFLLLQVLQNLQAENVKFEAHTISVFMLIPKHIFYEDKTTIYADHAKLYFCLGG